ICGRSSTGPRRGCAATSCYACLPFMSSITCARGSPLCSNHEAAAAKRASIVARAERSDAANRKQTTGRTADGLPVHSFQTLLADLPPYCRIQATTALNEKYLFTLHTKTTPIQQRAFELLGINPDRTQ